MEQEIFGVTRAAQYCAVSRGTLWKHIKSGALKASLTPGGHYRILKEDLEDFARDKGMYPLANYRPVEKKILIVDDDPHIRNVLTAMLSREGFETETASDGFEAGVKAMGFKPSLIILDLFMPGMDGFEACRRLKADPAGKNMKILIITGFDSRKNRDRIMEAGAHGYMVKPIERRTLLRQVEILLNGPRS
ncbi:MAG: response regulator [Deltaproteobacteria bacterium]|nr:response regulator [Deltaproteobacteria bacterium]